MNGNVYIIKKGNLVKIGRSVDPNARIRQIETQGGYNLEDIFISRSCSNYNEIERDMHRLLKEYRKIGEWFEFDFDEAVKMLKEQEYGTPLTGEEIKTINKRRAELLVKSSGIIRGIEEEQHYHCDYCNCPIEAWKPLKTYKAYRSCELFGDFYDAIWGLEEIGKEYGNKEVCNRCSDFKDEYPDVLDFDETIKEMIKIGIDTGVMTKYVKQNVTL